MKVRRISAAFAAGLLVFAFAGCGGSSNDATKSDAAKAIEKASGGKADANSDGKGFSADLKDKDGNGVSVDVGGSLPDGWPKDVLPVADGLSIVTAGDNTRDGRKTLNVMLRGKGNPDEILAAYKKNLESDGFKMVDESDNRIDATKDGKRATAIVDLADGDVVVNMNYGDNPDGYPPED